MWVPFGKKKRLGVVVNQGINENPSFTIKAISEIIDAKPLLSEPMLKLCHWVAEYYQTPLSEVITLALPKNLRVGKTIKKIPPNPPFPKGGTSNRAFTP